MTEEIVYVHVADNGTIELRPNSLAAHVVGKALMVFAFLPSALIDSRKLHCVCSKCGKDFGGSTYAREREGIINRAIDQGELVAQKRTVEIPTYDPAAKSVDPRLAKLNEKQEIEDIRKRLFG
jgi:hypothetical protein